MNRRQLFVAIPALALAPFAGSREPKSSAVITLPAGQIGQVITIANHSKQPLEIHGAMQGVYVLT